MNKLPWLAYGTACAFAGILLGGALVEWRSISRCGESQETTRLQACVKAGGSWVSGNCVGPLPAPQEGK